MDDLRVLTDELVKVRAKLQAQIAETESLAQRVAALQRQIDAALAQLPRDDEAPGNTRKAK